MKNGFIKVASAIPEIRVADPAFNVTAIGRLLCKSHEQQAEIIVFPELCISGYTCADLFLQQQLLDSCEAALGRLLNDSLETPVVAIVGMPLMIQSHLFNVAVVLQQGHILGIVPKTYIPNYNEFYEARWFSSATIGMPSALSLCGQSEIPVGTDLLFDVNGARFGIEICEDLWAPIPPSSHLCLHGADIIFNLSATNEVVSKNSYLRSLIAQQSSRCLAGYVYSSCGFGESTQDLVFGGNALIYENGRLLSESDRFALHEQIRVSEIDVERLRHERIVNKSFAQSTRETGVAAPRLIAAQRFQQPFTLTRPVDPHPFVPAGPELDARCNEILNIQTLGLAKRVVHTHSRTLVIGISGGLDSTLALLVAAITMDKLQRPRTDIVGITMPGFGTTDRTYNNAISLMQSLGITMHEISIKEACIQHFKDIKHDPNQHDVTYENTQARERTQILMDMANKTNGLVVGTGDLSELALGWATYNGDHMSMYAVNSGIPKTLVRYLVEWVSHQLDAQSEAVLQDVLITPVSPELLPADDNGNIAQKTEDLVGPYELHDFFLYYFVRFGFSPDKIFFLANQAFKDIYTEEVVSKWLKVFLRRFYAQQFKRSCMPDGPKVGSINLSPRGDWRMPSDAVGPEWDK